jgi:hypothetical protein
MMERAEALRVEAARKLRVADHMLTMTYPLVKDPKLLIAVLENVYQGMDATMGSMLLRERQAKRIPLYSDSAEGRLMAFRKHLGQKVPGTVLRTISEIRETIHEHKKSPVEFSRAGKFVICSEGYRVRTLSSDDLKRHIIVAKDFLRMIQ